MTDIWTPPPTAGDEPWDADLNQSINWLHSHVSTLEEQIPLLQNQIDALTTRVTLLEAKPEYIYNSYAWSFNADAPPAASGQLRLNDANPANATMIDIHKIDADGADRITVLRALTAGSQIRVGDWDDAAVIHRYNVTGPPTMSATNAQIPVSWISGSGVLPTQGQAKLNVAFLVVLVI